MRNLSLVLLFSILTLTMCDGMESQACTPTEGYACCFAPGEVNTIFWFKHLKQCNGGNTIPDSRSIQCVLDKCEQLRLRRRLPLQPLLH